MSLNVKTAQSLERINSVNIQAPPAPVLHELGVRVNGTYNASDDNCDGFSKVTVNVPADTKAITVVQNGVYNAALEGKDGYSQVTVAVPAVSPYVDDALVETYSAVGTRRTITTSEWITFPTQGTYEACFKYTSVDSPNGRIFHLGANSNNRLVLDVQSNTIPEVAINDAWTGVEGRSAVQILLYPNTFYTVALTVDSINDIVKMFVNGVEAETIDVPCSSLSSSNWGTTYLLRSDTSQRNTYGNLYSYRRHTRLLTAAEILQNYQADLQKYGQ